MKARVIINNGFRNLKKRETYFLEGNLIAGEINKGDRLFFNDLEIGEINEIESHQIDDFVSYILQVIFFDEKFVLSQMYGKELFIK